MGSGKIKRVLLAECGWCCGRSHQFSEETSITDAEAELERLGWKKSDKFGLLCSERCRAEAEAPLREYCQACNGPCHCTDIMAG